ncbi:MAG: DUF1611 domain-containing protein [candidate division KSB1 bacterium]|jgi:uncharacterized NAD-dependent epimerase/dehydratase family protein|nr:DUF1611 domain-containing protein [candidate division KSB1 bacterium]
MSAMPEGNAIVYCQGAYNTPNGKTAHGLVRRTARYRILSVIDSTYAGQDAGRIIDGVDRNIPVFSDLKTALGKQGESATHFVIGLAPDGGRLAAEARRDVLHAIASGLNIDSGLHDFLSEDEQFVNLAEKYHVKIRDVRKTPQRKHLHFFSGKIEEVSAFKIAVLGTDSAVGKRTTAWILSEAFAKDGIKAAFVGTGQTAWMQGASHCLILDSLVNDFVSGEIEHAVWSAWHEDNADVIIVEGQGSLMNPAYPGGFEILAAGRPNAVIMQHAPARVDYDGFPGYPVHPIEKQIEAVQVISGKPVIAVTVNHEGMNREEVRAECADIQNRTGLYTTDALLDGAGEIVKIVKRMM